VPSAQQEEQQQHAQTNCFLAAQTGCTPEMYNIIDAASTSVDPMKRKLLHIHDL
jgi:hypothetical protein